MSTWTDEELRSFAAADDLHVSPFRADGVSYGTPTWIWSVVVDGDLYARAYNGPRSRWYRSAMAQRGGRIRIAGAEHEVAFAPADGDVLHAVDEAYRAKYASSAYLNPMLNDGPRSATVRITPFAEHEPRERMLRG